MNKKKCGNKSVFGNKCGLPKGHKGLHEHITKTFTVPAGYCNSGIIIPCKKVKK